MPSWTKIGAGILQQGAIALRSIHCAKGFREHLSWNLHICVYFYYALSENSREVAPSILISLSCRHFRACANAAPLKTTTEIKLL
ncbi:uncharacterized protein ARMOST_12800 [Armillaria ostoyae]|uniref:Uncharacterized protein n=1 Tax=Armillaria ostoyae TaxID=47428 RepID=A0A284RKZ1_ARMOS|nr:uncharacterized protein ARMOST_12800 [Armillaria ostoyae]